MAKLSTHVLDTANGIPAEGVQLNFYRIENNNNVLIKSLVTNSDGRTNELLLDESNIKVGDYVIEFEVAEYFASKGTSLPTPPFLNKVPLHFSVFDASANYHVPLLISPWSYSTYRGS